jgi:PAS domain S-box-containing protein
MERESRDAGSTPGQPTMSTGSLGPARDAPARPVDAPEPRAADAATAPADAELLSCRSLVWMFDAFAERGLDPALLLEDVRVPFEHLRNPARLTDWETLPRLCENFGRHVPEAECVACAKASLHHPVFEVLRIPARLPYDVADLYRVLLRPEGGIIPRSYPMVTSTIVELERNRRMLLEVGVREPLRPIPVWDALLLGQLIALPSVLGFPDAGVVMTRTARGARYDVTMPAVSRAPLARLRRGIAWLFSARSTAHELVTTNALLEEKYRGLEREMAQRARAEATLAESEARYRLLAERVRDVIWTTDLEMQATYVSPSAQALFGYTAEEMLARGTAALMSPSTFERLGVLVADELARDADADPARSRTVEVEFIAKDGSPRFVEIHFSFLRDDAGRPVGIVGVTRDLSERRLAAERLRQAQKMESIGHLTGGIAHDFNNLLVALQGYTELALAHPKLPAPVRRHLEEVQRAGERAATLTQQLLAFGRKQPIQFMPTDLSALVDGLRPMLERVIPSTIEQRFDLEPHATAWADPGQLEQVIVNLVVNARDAMPDGGTLRFETRSVVVDEALAAAHPGARPGTHVRLSIADTGPGLTPEVRRRIFDPFFTTKPEGQGTGLGLSVAFGIVSQHGGLLTVESTPGAGAEFAVHLPRAHEPAVPAPVYDDELARGGTETILLVEDETAVRQLAERILAEAGYTVHSAADGVEALDILARAGTHVDLALLDVVMPRMDGRELRRRLTDAAPRLPILFVSGYVGDPTQIDFITDQERELVRKPYTAATLLRKVRRTLDRW